ncbi:MAG: hypothetical protein HY903_03560 [Deltaproteobacteria bacterium]|nr:hypothetical protein [Deltaproteobacteria bacterium]
MTEIKPLPSHPTSIAPDAAGGSPTSKVVLGPSVDCRRIAPTPDAANAPGQAWAKHNGVKDGPATTGALSGPGVMVVAAAGERGERPLDPVSDVLRNATTVALFNKLSKGETVTITSGAQKADLIPTANGFRVEAYTPNAKQPASVAEFFFTKEGKLVGSGDFSKGVSDALAATGKSAPDAWYFKNARELDHLDPMIVRESKKYFALSQGGRLPEAYTGSPARMQLLFANDDLARQFDVHAKHFWGQAKGSTVADGWGGKGLYDKLFDRRTLGPQTDVSLAGGKKLSTLSLSGVRSRPHVGATKSFLAPDSQFAYRVIGDASAGSEAALTTSGVMEMRSAAGALHKVGYEFGPEVLDNVEVYAVSHAHGDHFDLRAFKERVLQQKLPTTIVCSAEVERDIVQKLGVKAPKNLRFVREQALGDFLVKASANPSTGHGPSVGRTSVVNTKTGQGVALFTGDGDFNPASLSKTVSRLDGEAKALAGDTSLQGKKKLADLREDLRRLEALQQDLGRDYHAVWVDEGKSGFDTHGNADTVKNLEAQARAAGQDPSRFRRTHDIGYQDEAKSPNFREGKVTQVRADGTIVEQLTKLKADLKASGLKVVSGAKATELLKKGTAITIEYRGEELVVLRNDRALRAFVQRYNVGTANNVARELVINKRPAAELLNDLDDVSSRGPAAKARGMKIGRFELKTELPPWLTDKLKTERFAAYFAGYLANNPKLAKALAVGGKAAGPVVMGLLAAKVLYDNAEGLKRGDMAAVKKAGDALMQAGEGIVTGLPDLVFTFTYGATRFVLNGGDWKATVADTEKVANPFATYIWGPINRVLLDAALPGDKSKQ